MDPAVARGRAQHVLALLVAVNLLILWFFLGLGAYLGFHARVLDEDTLQRCAAAYTLAHDVGFISDFDRVRFAGPATVRFDAVASRKGNLTLKCVVEPVDDESTIDDALRVVSVTKVAS